MAKKPQQQTIQASDIAVTTDKLSLAQKTMMFWAISRAFNKGDGPYKNITTQEALSKCGLLYDNLGGHRTLAGKTQQLGAQIIGGRKRVKKSRKKNLLQLPVREEPMKA